MGNYVSAPINEAVSVLQRIDPGELSLLRARFPALADELALGMQGGAAPLDDLNRDRAGVMILALNAAVAGAGQELTGLHVRMANARKRRLIAQITTVFGSSGVVAGVVSGHALLTQLTAILTLVASLGNLMAGNLESLATPGSKNIYEAYDRATSLAYKAGLLSTELQLLLKHAADGETVGKAIAEANGLCFELSKWLSEIKGSSVPRQAIPAPGLGAAPSA